MIYIYKPSNDWHKRFDLTEGKQYHCEWNGEMVYSSTGVYFRLISDLGFEIEVHESQFVREKKLNEIGI